MTDILSDTARALMQAGLDAELVRAVIAAQRGRWGGGQVYVRQVDPYERESAIREAVARGLSSVKAAQVAGCSDDTVRRVIARGMGG
jgi:DNA invertase Pin-like site-specific DNA recombinase